MEVVNAFGLPALAVVLSLQAANPGMVNSMRPLDADCEGLRAGAAEIRRWQVELASYKPVLENALEQPVVNGADTTTPIWDRLRAGFGISYRNDAVVQVEIEAYRRHAYSLVQTLRRSESYLSYVLSRVEARGLPAELALLPVIESAYDPFARSSAGAVGIWQFMEGTAEQAGLQRDWWFDGRRDIVSATRAALDYLTALNDRFHGDWQLALAAYNAGGARVNQAIRTNRELGLPVDFRHLPLPEETRAYVPRLLALRTIIENPESYGITLPEQDENRSVRAVDTDGPLDLEVAARLAGITLDELQRLNPGFTRSVVPPGRSHRLLVPARTARHFRERLVLLTNDQRVQSIRYRVQPGDSLSMIAQNSRTTVAQLRRINQLDSNRIIAGNVLIVPVGEQAQDISVALEMSAENG